MSFIQDIKNEINARAVRTELQPFRDAGAAFHMRDAFASVPLVDAQIREFVSGVFLATASGAIRLSVNPKATKKTALRNQYSATTKTYPPPPNLSPITSHLSPIPASGYHIDFTFENQNNARELCSLLAEYDILPKLTQRGGTHVIYIKSSDCICNLLALMGATTSLVTLSDEIAVRDIRNRANRRANCDTHNIEKQVAAAAAQVEFIRGLKQSGRLARLPEKLRAVAEARLSAPDATYEELAAAVGLSKSGLVNRLRKILNIDNEANEK
jgi:hypothetical protein